MINLFDSSLTWYVIPAAFALDIIIGDPQFRHHPIRYMGCAIEAAEPIFRRIKWNTTLSGGLMAVVLITLSGGLTALVLEIAGGGHPLMRGISEIVIVYFCIACRGLESAAMQIYRLLRQNRLNDAKAQLSMIVGRDVTPLDETGVARATVETVAENLVDGVISPLFYAAIGGAPLMVAYKMVNTLDSMVGYKNDTYRDFGKIPAKIDDVANWIPARLSVLVIALCAWIFTGSARSSWNTARKEGRRHASPNAGWPEAAFAGAMKVRLGGANSYFGQIVEKPYIGVRFGDVRVRDIRKACDLMLASSLVWTLAMWGLSR